MIYIESIITIMRFVGRYRELEYLEGLYCREGVKTCMIVGKRRIGKSKLIKQFCTGKRNVRFEFTIGSLRDNLEYMTDVLNEMEGLERDVPESVYRCLRRIADLCREAPTVVVFDEFQYLFTDEEDDALSSEIQRFVDQLIENTDTMVIICDSYTSMMLEMTKDPARPLFGRFQNILTLKPLPIEACRELHPDLDDLDCLKLYLTIGGVPSFHREAVGDTYEQCVWNAFLRENAPLQTEIQLLLGSGVKADSPNRLVVRAVCGGAVTIKTISEWTKLDRGTCSNRIRSLMELDVLDSYNPMYGAPKHPRFHVKDDAVAFYFGVYEINRPRIDTERPERTLERLEHSISTFLGMRFEGFCEEYLRKSYPCLETGRWWGPSKVIGEDGKPKIVDIDVTARIESDGSIFDAFCECKMRHRQTGFTELNTLVERVGFTKANVNPRYFLFSPSGFTEDLTDYAESHRDVMLVDLPKLMGNVRPDPI